MYLVEKIENKSFLFFKNIIWEEDTLYVKQELLYEFEDKLFFKLKKKLYKSNLFSYNKDFLIYPMNVLIESNIQNKYNYININQVELKKNRNSKRILKCFKILDDIIIY